ncbi:MAG: hypothetical protein VCD16_02570, partial [Planctomycetota bacterium]
MDTRGTNLPGWFGAFFLLCAIAGGIVVSCKTTEPPAGTQKDESAGAEEGAALPWSSENPVAGEASIEQGAVVEIGKGEGEPPPSIEDGPIVGQAPAPPPAIEKEEAPERAPAAPPVAEVSEVADVPTATGSEIVSKVDSPLEDSRALALLDELNLHRPAVLPGKPAVSPPRKEKSDPGESQSAAKEASEEVKVPAPVVESLEPSSPVGNEAEPPEINTDVLDALNRMKAARGKVSSDPESAAEAGVSPEEKKEPPVSEPAPAAGERKEEPVLRGGEPAAKPAPVPVKAEPVPKPAPRPQGYITFKTLFRKGSTEAISFVESVKPDWIQKGHLSKVEGKKQSLVIFGETDAPTDPLTLKIVDMLDRYDQLDLDIKREVLRPKYVDARLAMDALLMSGICNVWQLTSASDALTWKEGTKQRTLSRTTEMYVEKGGGIANSPLSAAPKIPFVYDMPSKDAVSMPTGYGGNSNTGSLVMTFDKSSSTEMRGGMMTVGTAEDIAKIKAFVETIDVPARRIMIEVQLIELEANKLTDFGIDSAQFGGGHTIGSVGLPLPGEAIVQPGVPGARAEGSFVPDVMNEGLKLLFDDTSLDIQGRFMAALHMLVR